jgi:hypothetical protein
MAFIEERSSSGKRFDKLKEKRMLGRRGIERAV